MTVYCGVDFHARQQTVAWCDTSDGEIHLERLDHQDQDQVRSFYARWGRGAIVGLEASGYSQWFEALLATLGHQSWVGETCEIRRRARSRQKNDRRDAELILDLLLKDEFPRVRRLTEESLEVLRRLRDRHRLVKMRTQASNALYAIALNAGSSRKAKLLSRGGRERLQALSLSPVQSRQREQWLGLIDQFTERINELERELEALAGQDARVVRLRTHPGIGLLTGLAVVHTLSPVGRFSSGRKVAAYVGLEPCERSSADKQRWGGISKAGSRLLRYLLIEAAQSAVRGDPELGSFYRRLVYRRGHPKALAAAARKLLLRAYILLRDEIDYDEFRRRGVTARPARFTHGLLDA